MTVYLAIPLRNNIKPFSPVQYISKGSSSQQEPISKLPPTQLTMPKPIILSVPPVTQHIPIIVPLLPLQCVVSKDAAMRKKVEPPQVVTEVSKVNLLCRLMFTY